MSLPLLPPGPAPATTPAAAGVPPRPLWGDLSVRIDRPDGQPIRWSGDELDAANVPCDLQFGSSMPGGYKGCTCTLFRALTRPGREGMFDEATIVGPGGEIVWQGRLQQMPQSSDSGGRVNPQAVGWSSHLDDDQTLRLLGTDRELDGWGPIAAGRRQSVLNAPFAPADGTTRWDDTTTGSAGPVIDLRRPRGSASWSSPAGRPFIAVRYDCAGQPLSGIEFRARNPTDLGGWSLQVAVYSDLACTTVVTTYSVAGAAITEGLLLGWAFPAGARAIEIALYFAGAPAGNPANEYGLMLAEVAVYGNLPGGQPTPSYVGTTTGPTGFLASDVLPEILRRAAPLLRFDSTTIAPTDFRIRNLVLRDPASAAAAIEHLNRYHLWDWGVWENRTFHWGPRAGGRTWKITTDDGLDLSLEGDTADAILNGIAITYTDYGGRTHTVGPPGSGAEREDARLVSHDPTNPATLRGIRRWRHQQLSAPADHETACTIGQIILGAETLATRRGSATVRGTVYDDAGEPHPAWRIRAGDTLIVTDRPDDPPRRIIETSYAHAGRSNQLTLDNTAATADAIVERLVNSLTGVL